MNNWILLFIVSCLAIGCVSGHCHSDYAQIKERAPASEQAIRAAFGPENANAEPDKHVFVYKDDGSRQCAMGKPIAVEVMEQQLKGIQVFSRRADHDHLMHMQMCGATTGKINVYEISAADLAKAKKLGFKQMPNSTENSKPNGQK